MYMHAHVSRFENMCCIGRLLFGCTAKHFAVPAGRSNSSLPFRLTFFTAGRSVLLGTFSFVVSLRFFWLLSEKACAAELLFRLANQARILPPPETGCCV